MAGKVCPGFAGEASHSASCLTESRQGEVWQLRLGPRVQLRQGMSGQVCRGNAAQAKASPGSLGWARPRGVRCGGPWQAWQRAFLCGEARMSGQARLGNTEQAKASPVVAGRPRHGGERSADSVPAVVAEQVQESDWKGLVGQVRQGLASNGASSFGSSVVV